VPVYIFLFVIYIDEWIIFMAYLHPAMTLSVDTDMLWEGPKACLE